jgi:hypothetical protein
VQPDSAILSFDAPATVALEEYATVELTCAAPNGAGLELHIAGVLLEPFLRPDDPLWRWRWTAPGAAGAFRVTLCAIWPDGTQLTQAHRLEVRPRKLDAARYQALLSDVQALARHLVQALSGGATPALLPRPAEAAPQTPAEALALFTGAELARFAAAVQRIAQRPPERIRPTIQPVAPGQARDLSRLGSTRLEPAADSTPTPDAPANAAQLRAIPEARAIPTHDSYELRFLQRTLSTLARRLEQLATTPELPPQVTADLIAAQRRLRALRALPTFTAVPALEQDPGPTPRLQRDADYRVVLRMWQRLRRRPELGWNDPTLELPVAELPVLYERWCTLVVAATLLHTPGWNVTHQRLFATASIDADWLINLPTDVPLLELERADGTAVALLYQPRYRPNPAGARPGSLDRHTRIPDLVISVTSPATPAWMLVLDAKYRLDATGGVPESALADAYSYLGSIGRSDGTRSVRSVALLYPGAGSAEHYASGVAALPLLPGATTSLADWLLGFPLFSCSENSEKHA